jgi:hypothetical protein
MQRLETFGGKELGQRVVLSFEGEGRSYNSIFISLTHYVPPAQRGEVEYDEPIMIHGVKVRRTISYGHRIFTWSLDGFWIQLSWLGEALDEDEAVRIADGIVLPPTQNE